MSQESYGIRRFALLNTAGYSLGIFPLEHPLSVYGANNLGKSASINALSRLQIFSVWPSVVEKRIRMRSIFLRLR